MTRSYEQARIDAGVAALRNAHGQSDEAAVTAIRKAFSDEDQRGIDQLMAESIDRVPLVRGDETPQEAAGRLDPIPTFHTHAISAMRDMSVSVLVGASGGERTRLLRIVADMHRQYLGAIGAYGDVLELAATRKAALRMGPRATTVHDALGWDPVTSTFEHDAFNPLGAEVIVVDYADMLDKETITLLMAARGEATLVLTRDPNMNGSSIPSSPMDVEMDED